MKIRRKSADEAVRLDQFGQPKAAIVRKNEEEVETTSNEQVNIKIGHLISQELNPSKMAEERRARVEELKRLVQEGRYHRSSEEIAEAVASEVDMEVSVGRLFDGDTVEQ